MAEKLDCVVVGAGVVGLAVGRSLALAGRDVVVLETESQIGMHASSRNSEVIHAGFHYPENSLKAMLCVQGKEMLYAYCEEHQVGSKRLGKLIVAPAGGDLDRLVEIEAQAERNGVTDLAFLSADEVRELEPEVVCAGGLLSPSTGIIDSHGLMMALQTDVEAAGSAVVLRSEVTNLQVEGDGLGIESGGEKFVCNTLINSAGLWAQVLVADLELESRLKSLPQVSVQPVHFAKGHYFAYQGKSPFRHLVYPLPSGGGLGIHATNDLSGTVRFGPDVMWVDSIDYEFDQSRKPAFVAAIESYFPPLDEDKLTPAYTGIRPKLNGPDGSDADFEIQGEAEHGVPGLINLFGIDSPGLTASLAIGEYVRKMVQ
ncbi:MAG: FAD-dependent oxidoreductase [Desulfobulbaceae bacterium]|nr:FAD-dependent oxidoreductase [Desulfobulbaceae bacterium]